MIRRRGILALVGGAAAIGSATVLGIVLPAAPASATTTLHFYGVQERLTSTSPTGQPLAPDALFRVGDRYDATDLFYAGQQQRHAAQYSGSDHVSCVVTVASTTAERQTCSDQFAFGSAMLLATNVTVTFHGRTATIPINGGTGKYKNAHGTLVTAATPNATNGAETTENTFSLTGVASRPTAGSVASGTTLPFYSVQQTLRFSNAAGRPLKNGNNLPDGSSYDSTDLYYAGTQKQHASDFSASDHLSCTFSGNDLQTCNSQIAIAGSLLLLNNVTEPASGATVSAPINDGTGTYQNARGTFQSGADAITTDVVITLAR